MKTSTNIELKGWSNLYQPKSMRVNIREWLTENGLQDDAATVKESATFGDFEKCQKGEKELDWERYEALLESHADTFLRDVIFAAVEAAPFFVPGWRYRCIKAVKGDFTKGETYEQTHEPTQWFGWLRNNKGEAHGWPQPQDIARVCNTHDMKPEAVDPRLYFEPVA